jgi:hypothetical protein
MIRKIPGSNVHVLMLRTVSSNRSGGPERGAAVVTTPFSTCTSTVTVPETPAVRASGAYFGTWASITTNGA